VNQVRRDPLDFVVGDRVPGTPWVMRGTLGEGGMGPVLDVVKEPGIQGAMKVMPARFARQTELVDRFFEEVRLLAQLRHPNIVQVFDFDQLDDGTPYVVMERLHGVSLRTGMRNLRQKGTPISAKLTYEITRQLCEGLFRAHSNTPVIVHRDVRPETVFFHQPPGADTVVKVIDFGFAAVLDGARDRRVSGSRYMAPEQIDGGSVSPATDVYAVALVLYELLTGRFPWDVDLDDEPAVVEAHLHRPPTPPSRHTPWVPELVDEWILRSLSKDQGRRPSDAYQFVAKLYQLQFVGDGPSLPAADIRLPSPSPPPTRHAPPPPQVSPVATSPAAPVPAPSGRPALLLATIGASLVVGLFVAILYLNRPKAMAPLVSSTLPRSASETPPQAASASSLRNHTLATRRPAHAAGDPSDAPPSPHESDDGRDPLHAHP
jgi:eukaryotic-like serine/threonine-protein kinase